FCPRRTRPPLGCPLVPYTTLFRSRAFSFNRASDLQLNFYENHQPVIEGLSSRPFVSPIAQNALSYYHYQYMGTTDENGQGVVKIDRKSTRLNSSHAKISYAVFRSK